MNPALPMQSESELHVLAVVGPTTECSIPAPEDPRPLRVAPAEVGQDVEGALRATVSSGGSLEGGMSLLQALRDLSAAIPHDVPFEIVSLFWETGKMEIYARTDSFKTVNVIQELLEGSTRISQAAISNARHREEGQDVEFRLTVRLEG